MKSIKFKTILMASSLLLGLGACQQKESVKQNDVVHVTASEKMDTDSLTDAGEQLVSPYTFMLADRAFDMALAKDPYNEKALFYKAFLKQMMALRGAMVRLHPFVAKYGDAKKWNNWTKSFPKSPLKSFLMDGGEEPATEETVQRMLTEYRDGADEFRRFVKKHPDMTMTMNLNPYVWERRIKENLIDSCNSQETADGFVVNCDASAVAELKMNDADLVVLGQIAAGQVLMLTAYTSYGLNGLAIIAKNTEHHIYQSEQQVLQYLGSQSFGKLRRQNSMNLLRELGSDYSAAAKWAIQYQSTLCPNGSVSNSNRPGFLINTGLCVSDLNESQRSLALLDSLLAGVTQVDLEKSNGQRASADIDILAITRNPGLGLLDLASPAVFNSCGEVVRLNDRTFGGTFVNGDAEQFVLRPKCTR